MMSYKIPFSSDGKPLKYVGMHNIEGGIEWRDNEPFVATMRLISMESGRSAKHFIVEDDNGTQYVMFAKDLMEFCKSGSISFGLFDYTSWQFIKRGRNYGIVPCLK